MTSPAVIFGSHTQYYIDKRDSRLLHDNTGKYGGQPDVYRHISRREYIEIKDLQENYTQHLTKYQGIHKGKVIHVFGNGPSLNDIAAKQDWSNQITIGVNAAGLHIKPLTYWLSVDNLWDMRHERRDLYDFVGQWLKDTKGKTIQFIRRDATLLVHRTDRVRARGEALSWQPDEMFIGTGTEPMPLIQQGLYWSLQSTQAAMDLARHMGAAAIMLWGVDLNDRSHSYTGSAAIPADQLDQPGKPWQHFEKIVEGYKKIKAACDGMGCEVLNMNPNSKLDVFKKVKVTA